MPSSIHTTMEKLKTKSHNMKLLSLALLLIITPLLPTSLRLKYLYFIVNILIIALGAEAGLLSFLQSHQDPKPVPSLAAPLINHEALVVKNVEEKTESASEQGIFFVGGGESGSAEDDDQVVEDGVEDHELFHKAEKFIGNFYKQLKMQRQESWNGFDRVSQH